MPRYSQYFAREKERAVKKKKGWTTKTDTHYVTQNVHGNRYMPRWISVAENGT